MGRIYELANNWYVEAREKSIVLAKINGEDRIELDYEDLGDEEFLENAKKETELKFETGKKTRKKQVKK